MKGDLSENIEVCAGEIRILRSAPIRHPIKAKES